MSDQHPFDVNYYRQLLEAFHDSQKYPTQRSTNAHNKYVDKTCDYLDKCRPFTPNDTSEFKLLLTHPKKMVRVNSAIHLLSMGEVAAWGPMIEAAAPLFMPNKGDEGVGNHISRQKARADISRKHTRN